MRTTAKLAAVVVGAALLGPQVIGQPDVGGAEKSTGDTEEREPIDLSDWMTGFHRSPDPDRVGWAIREMNTTGLLESDGGLCAAFLAEVFRQYPDRVASWIGEREGLPDDARHWVYIALWWSDVPGSVSILAAAAEEETPELEAALRKYSESDATPLLELPLTRPERLDMLWASYFASGKAAYVERLATALEAPPAEEETLAGRIVRGAARWSLVSNARQHDDVREVLTELYGRSSGALRAELEAMLEEARSSPPPEDDDEYDL